MKYLNEMDKSTRPGSASGTGQCAYTNGVDLVSRQNKGDTI